MKHLLLNNLLLPPSLAAWRRLHHSIHAAVGLIERHMACMFNICSMAAGYRQQQGRVLRQVSSPVCKMDAVPRQRRPLLKAAASSAHGLSDCAARRANWRREGVGGRHYRLRVRQHLHSIEFRLGTAMRALPHAGWFSEQQQLVCYGPELGTVQLRL